MNGITPLIAPRIGIFATAQTTLSTVPTAA